MKRVITILVVLFSVLCVSAQSNKDKVDVHDKGNSGEAPRTEMKMPEIFVESLASKIYVKYYSVQSYTLNLYAPNGVCVYSMPVITDGNEHTYVIWLTSDNAGERLQLELTSGGRTFTGEVTFQ